MITVGIITVSDRSSKGERKDLSGKEILHWIENNKYELADEKIVPDEIGEITSVLKNYIDRNIQLILTTGGTGCSPRDVTPEATLSVIERETPGFAEAMRSLSMKVTPHAMLSRAVAGISKNSLIINLPGSPKAVRENLSFIEKAIPHGIELIKGSVSDCGG